MNDQNTATQPPQPLQVTQNQPVSQPIQQPKNTKQPTETTTKTDHKKIEMTPVPHGETDVEKTANEGLTPFWNKIITKYGHWVHIVVIWGLIIQGLRSLYISGVFILVEMPIQEIALKDGLIGQEDINTLASRIILMGFSGFLSMVFALRISALKSGLAKKIHTTIGVIIFFANAELIQFLNSQNSSEIISRVFLEFLQK
jgi:hypothetical protein